MLKVPHTEADAIWKAQDFDFYCVLLRGKLNASLKAAAAIAIIRENFTLAPFNAEAFRVVRVFRYSFSKVPYLTSTVFLYRSGKDGTDRIHHTLYPTV